MKKLFYLIFVMFFMFSCDNQQEKIEVNGTWVRVNVDWSKAGIEPEGASFCFYPEREGMNPIRLETHTTLDSMKLRIDNYRVLVFNETANSHENIFFRGMDKYETVEACAQPIEVPDKYSKETEERAVTNLDILAVERLTDFEITDQMMEDDERPTLNFVPESRMHVVTLTIRAKGLENVSLGGSIGSLSGMTGAINLSQVEQDSDPVTHYFNFNDITFDEGSNTEGTMSATLSTFGPLRTVASKSENIKNVVTLYFKLRDGTEQTPIEYDITDLIDQAIEANDDLNIEIGSGDIIEFPYVEDTGGSGINVNVGDWGDETIIDTPVEL